MWSCRQTAARKMIAEWELGARLSGHRRGNISELHMQESLKRDIRKCSELEMKIQSIKNWWDAANAILIGKFTALEKMGEK